MTFKIRRINLNNILVNIYMYIGKMNILIGVLLLPKKYNKESKAVQKSMYILLINKYQ